VRLRLGRRPGTVPRARPRARRWRLVEIRPAVGRKEVDH
jgi:hypothetical protein